MKYKSILFVLLIAFTFNIFHDTVISLKSNEKCPIVVQLIEEVNPNISCGDISSTHGFFHIFAIFNIRDILFLDKTNLPINISNNLYIFYFPNSIFRPPIV